MFNINKKEFKLGSQTCTIETGKIARQAGGAVLVTLGEVVVLCTAVGNKKARAEQSFFPLTINYQEKYYATGRIPGGFFKREGRPTEKETLTSRLIDRPLRPLFPNGMKNEVQVICTVIGSDTKQSPDMAAMIGASAALSISDIPFDGPIGAIRVGYKNDEFVTNPSYEELATSELDMVVASTDEAVLMVESEANELSEQVMLDAVMYAYQQSKVIIDNIKQLVAACGKDKWQLEEPAENTELFASIIKTVSLKIAECYQIIEKTQRQEQLSELKESIFSQYEEEQQEEVQSLFSKIEKQIVRDRILAGEKRIDGRDMETVRNIEVEVGLLPQTHGSALFTRGETQAIVVATLGTIKEGQIIDAIEGESKSQFMLHYNFPPFSVGECGRMASAGRREIGHGMLAKRSIRPMLPDLESFGYSLRVVSDITESNGSSSMATVCGTSLALMDAGFPIKQPVAGVAMGLVKDGDQFQVLTDILGDEDHLGDMDFKVAGTKDGITALQMDIKISGITKDIMEIALKRALQARIHILEKMNAVIEFPRVKMSDLVPQNKVITIPKNSIGAVIGKGGSTIKALIEATKAKIDIKDNGDVTISGRSSCIEQAIVEINKIVEDYTGERQKPKPKSHLIVGRIYSGRVNAIVDFGAFVDIDANNRGLVHKSEITESIVTNVADYVLEGQDIKVKIIGIEKGKIKLTMKDIDQI